MSTTVYDYLTDCTTCPDGFILEACWDIAEAADLAKFDSALLGELNPLTVCWVYDGVIGAEDPTEMAVTEPLCDERLKTWWRLSDDQLIVCIPTACPTGQYENWCDENCAASYTYTIPELPFCQGFLGPPLSGCRQLDALHPPGDGKCQWRDGTGTVVLSCDSHDGIYQWCIPESYCESDPPVNYWCFYVGYKPGFKCICPPHGAPPAGTWLMVLKKYDGCSPPGDLLEEHEFEINLVEGTCP